MILYLVGRALLAPFRLVRAAVGLVALVVVQLYVRAQVDAAARRAGMDPDAPTVRS